MISCRIINLISTMHSSASLCTPFYARASLWSWTAQLFWQHQLLCLYVTTSFSIWCCHRLQLLSQSHHVPFLLKLPLKKHQHISAVRSSESISWCSSLPLNNVRKLEALCSADRRMCGERRNGSAGLLLPQSGKPQLTPFFGVSENIIRGLEDRLLLA